MPARKKAVSTQKRHLTKQEIEERTQAEASVQTDVEEIMKPPAWLNSTIAKNEWKRVIPTIVENQHCWEFRFGSLSWLL